jgi:hypothetical protein
MKKNVKVAAAMACPHVSGAPGARRREPYQTTARMPAIPMRVERVKATTA